MKKNLYSLTLSDEVVREVDALAHRMGTNRSALVNQILAEYVSVPTPERRINDIFEAIEQLMSPIARAGAILRAELVHHVAQIEPRSYKYRPTRQVRGRSERRRRLRMGTLNVVFRTQSAALISGDDELLPSLGAHRGRRLAPPLGSSIACALYDGRFVRPLAMPRRTRAAPPRTVAGASRAYVQLFDRLLKGYLERRL